jgi:hypothetical protein
VNRGACETREAARVGNWWMGEFKSEGRLNARLSVLMSDSVRIYPTQLPLRGVVTRLSRRWSRGQSDRGSQPGVAQAREGDSTQLIPLDDERGDEERARTAGAR